MLDITSPLITADVTLPKSMWASRPPPGSAHPAWGLPCPTAALSLGWSEGWAGHGSGLEGEGETQTEREEARTKVRG